MPFPQTETELAEAGYKYQGTGKCRKCQAEINWYETPKGRMMPLDPDLKPHWSSCPFADDFRKGK